MFTKKVAVFVLGAALLSSPAFGQSGWKERKSAWDPLLEHKEQIALMTGGDLNGDYVDDLAVIYRSGPEQGLVVLISDREEYRKYQFQGERLDMIYNTELAKAQSLWIRQGRIEALCPFDGQKLSPDLTANAPAQVRFKFFETRVKLTDIVFNATRQQDGLIAQVWFNADIGSVYIEYLAEPEKVGGKRLYYFRYYYRLAAHPLAQAAIDASDDEWVLFAYPVYLQNSPVGNPITYGFDKWKSDFDLSGEIYAGYDQSRVYLWIEVSDDVFNQAHSGDGILRGDHVELWFAGDEGDKVQIGISPGNFADLPPEARLWYQGGRAASDRPLDSVQVASRQTDYGYVLECAIPFELLPAGYQAIGARPFSVVISDSDQAAKQEKLLSSSSLKWGESYSLGELVFTK